ncbi:uncharacterized protein LOC115622945 isoform X2 [Scaptodrosophila lebanonensis]|uniref:Uncharacterized protein LOC115622945 isoform X2 n=1 Tax=Drosophila lebanonensis TaxID=7225 RepID=A0A6J2TD74_DROLE|nr:uncharacterized protein LOC115622945 isoform X2 [Scaptodrosophila lebanonensis]
MNSWLRNSLTEIARTNRHTDCTFTIEMKGCSRVFPCHKLIFSCASDVFDRMLFGGYNESSSGMVKLTDVHPDIFEKFRDYVYGYEYDKLKKYDFDTLIQLSEFGNKYLVESIKDDCLREILERKYSYDIGELLRLFQCAHNLNVTKFIDWVSWTNSKSLMGHAGIYEFNTDVFKSYLKVVSGKLSESERFNVLEMYLKYHGLDDVSPEEEAAPEFGGGDIKENTSYTELSTSDSTDEVEEPVEPKSEVPEPEKNICSKYVFELIALIDFSRFTPKEFYDGPGKSNFLSLAQKYEYLYKIARNASQAKEELEQKLERSHSVEPQSCVPMFASSQGHPNHHTGHQGHLAPSKCDRMRHPRHRYEWTDYDQ